jgi:hypothetical protein
MDSNTHSASPADGLTGLAAAIRNLAAEDPDDLTDAALAEEVLALRRLVHGLEGQWLQKLAALDARGAAGADQGVQAASTASWLRNRLRMGANAATGAVRTARALFRGPLALTAHALTAGDISAAHAGVLAAGTHQLAHYITAQAEPTLLDAARRLDPPRLRRVLAHLQGALDPGGADDHTERRHEQRWLRVDATFEGMVAVDGLLEPEAGQTLMAALEPLARPAGADDTRSGGQRTADALTELARRALEAGQLPQTGGVRPQLTVMVDLDSLLGDPGAVAGELGWLGSLAPQGCRRLACDGAATRVLVTRQPPDDHGPGDQRGNAGPTTGDPAGTPGRASWLQTAMARLPRTLGGRPSQPLEVGRTSRVVTGTQRIALAVRDEGCVFPACTRPVAWCDAHHLVHWLDGGPTDLANLVLLCRAHHRAVHEGGWQLTRHPDGHLTTTPPHRRPHHRPHQRAA